MLCLLNHNIIELQIEMFISCEDALCCHGCISSVDDSSNISVFCIR